MFLYMYYYKYRTSVQNFHLLFSNTVSQFPSFKLHLHIFVSCFFFILTNCHSLQQPVIGRCPKAALSNLHTHTHTHTHTHNLLSLTSSRIVILRHVLGLKSCPLVCVGKQNVLRVCLCVCYVPSCDYLEFGCLSLAVSRGKYKLWDIPLRNATFHIYHVFINDLFNIALNIIDIIEGNDKFINGWWIGKNAEGLGKIKNKKLSVAAEIRTSNLLNTYQNCSHLSHLAQWIPYKSDRHR